MRKFKLYSVIFPTLIWFIYVPLSLVASLVGNFIIDSLVLIILSIIMFKKIDRDFLKDSIVKVYFIGLFSDIVGSAYLSVLGLISGILSSSENEGEFFFEFLRDIHVGFQIDCFSSIISFLFMFSGVVLSSILVYYLNYKYTYTNDVYWLCKKQKIITCLILTVFTAPYTFLLPPILLMR